MSYRVGEEPVPGYRLIERLGRGSYGQVWKARGQGGIDFALKIISLENRGGLKEFKALRLMKSIRHPNLTSIVAFWLKDEDENLLDEAQVVGVLTEESRAVPAQKTVAVGSLKRTRPSELIIVMDLGDRTLSDRLEECLRQGLPGIPPKELFEYMEPAARAIDFLNSPRHDLGHGPNSPIQHCDIKPQNILIVGGSVKVCDFGLAREFGANVKTTSAGATLAYGAPELLEQLPPSPSTDQYSLAITYVELRTGRLPFSNPDSQAQVIEAHLHSRLDLSSLDEEEREVILKATSRDPSRRFPSAQKLIKALEQVCPDKPDSFYVPGPAKRNEELGGEIPPGYRLIEPRFQVAHERSWWAVGPGRKRASVLIRNIDAVPVDRDAIEIIQHLPHRNLAEMQEYWLLDENNDPVPEGPPRDGIAKRPTKFVVALSPADTLADRSLECLKYTGQAMKPRELLGYMDQLADALDCLNAPQHAIRGQQASILHCNVRPESCLLDGGRIRLANFGAARVLIGAEMNIDAGIAAGDSPFDPPEWRTGRLTNSSDQFSLAVTYLQLRTANQGWESKSASARSHSKTPPGGDANLRGLNPLELEVIQRAASGDPSKRFESCQQFVEQLRRARPMPVSQVTAPVADTIGSIGDEQLVQHEIETTETPNSDSVRTKVDSFRAAEPEVIAAGPVVTHGRDRTIRLLKTVAAMLVPVVIGAVWYLLPPSPAPILEPPNPERTGNEGQDPLIPTDPAARLLGECKNQWNRIITLPAVGREAGLNQLSKTLDRARMEAPGTEFIEFEKLAMLADPRRNPSEVDAVIQWYTTRLKANGEVTYLEETTLALSDLADRNPQYLEDAARLVSAIRKQRDLPSISVHLKELYETLVAGRLRTATESSNRDEYFKGLKRVCETAQQDGVDRLINLALAESLMEPTAQELGRISALVRGCPPLPDHKLYETYVRVLHQVIVEQGEASAADLSDLSRDVQAANDLDFAVAPRRRSLTRLFVESAKKLRVPIDRNRPELSAIVFPFGEKEGRERARLAFDWLTTAQKISQQESLEKDVELNLRANLALATWHKHQNDGAIPRPFVPQEVLSNSDLGATRLALLYVDSRSQPDTPEGRLEAITSFAELVEASFSTRETPSDDEIRTMYGLIVARLTDEASRGGDKSFDKQLARLAYRKGTILDEFPNLELAGSKTEKYDAFDLAARRDPTNGRYFSARGFARFDEEPWDLELARDDAKKAIDKSNDFHGGHGLSARVARELAKTSNSGSDRRALAKKAVEEGNIAVANSKSDTRWHAHYLLDLAQAYVELAANVSSQSATSKIGLLQRAVETASNAERLFEYPKSKEYAEKVIGYAYMMMPRYDKALVAFDAAFNLNQNPAILVDIGRCHYERGKSDENTTTRQGDFNRARQALKSAKRADATLADAHRWLGEVELREYEDYRNGKRTSNELKSKFELAEASFRNAMNVAATRKSAYFPRYVDYWIKSLREEPNSDVSSLPSRIEDVLHDPKCPKDKSQRNTLLQAKAKFYEGHKQWKEALATYNVALQNDDKIDKSDIDLLNARRIVNWELGKSKRDLSSYLNARKDAARVLELLGPEATSIEHREHGRACFYCWQLATDRGTLLGDTMTSFDAALTAAPKDFDLLNEYKNILREMTVSDPATKPTLRPKRKEIIQRILAITTNALERNTLEKELSDIDSLAGSK